MSQIKTVGIIGAGKLGVTVAQLAFAADYKVYIAGSGSPDKIALATKIITPGAVAVTAAEAIQRGDVIILAMPLGKFSRLDAHLFEGKLVIDAMNYWPEVDGVFEDIIPKGKTTSEMVQRHLPTASVVKALNHMAYHDLRDGARAKTKPGRKAIAIAGDDTESVATVQDFVDTLGFDPLYIGKLEDSRALETGQPGFGANLNKVDLERVILKL